MSYSENACRAPQRQSESRRFFSIISKWRAVISKWRAIMVAAALLPAVTLLAPATHASEARKATKTAKKPATAGVASAASADAAATTSKKASIADLAPAALTFLNSGPVYGLPGTQTGSFSERTQVTGDWGGYRDKLVDHGLFIDGYTTSTYQGIASGGLKTGSSFTHNSQVLVNLDLGRAGLIPGGLFHFSASSRYGATSAKSYRVGSSVPQNQDLIHPDPLYSNNVLPTEYYYLQPLSSSFSLLGGKVNALSLTDQTLFASNSKNNFANLALTVNAIAEQFVNPWAWVGLMSFFPTENWRITGGIVDPSTKATNFAQNAFKYADIYGTTVLNYSMQGLPGQIQATSILETTPKTNLNKPFVLSFPSSSENTALSNALGLPQTIAVTPNYRHFSWMVIGNFSQYLYVVDDQETIDHKLKTGQNIRGLGVFGRLGGANSDSSVITKNASLALFGEGLLDSRKYDSFGVGFYYNNFSEGFKKNLSLLTLGTARPSNETGVEVFYDFALTPAIRLIPSYQHIWNPLMAELLTGRHHADVFLVRTSIYW